MSRETHIHLATLLTGEDVWLSRKVLKYTLVAAVVYLIIRNMV